MKKQMARYDQKYKLIVECTRGWLLIGCSGEEKFKILECNGRHISSRGITTENEEDIIYNLEVFFFFYFFRKFWE